MGLLLVERMVLESVANKERTLQEIADDTSLSINLLKNILASLIQRGILNFKAGCYQLGHANKSSWLAVINKKENIKEELSELFSSFVNQSFSELEKKSEGLRIKKVWMTRDEQRQLEIQLKSLQHFLDSIKESRKRNPQLDGKTSELKVIFWGQSSYKDLVEESLRLCS